MDQSMAETTFLGSNINLVKAHNLQAILLSLLYESEVSRVQLAQKTSLSTTTITNLVAELLEQGLVVERESSAFEGEPEYMFVSPAMRQAGYEAIPRTDRQACHGRIAAWLMAHSPGRIEENLGLISDHLAGAGRAADRAHTD